MRPFYFFVTFWGKHFADLFANFCLPTLLAPNNIPALRNRGNRFLIATTASDWESISRTAIFRLLEQHLVPEWLEISPPADGVSAYEHMGAGHLRATQRAYEDKAYGILVTPDFMISDGAVAALQSRAVDGTQVVLSLALRFGEEPLFHALQQMGLLGPNARLGEEGRALSIGTRQLARAAINSFHSEALRYEWEAPYFSDFPCACWWRVPGEEAIVAHGFSWGPLLMDYGAVREHDRSTIENWTIDGDYVYRNFPDFRRIHVVQDSDELIQVSWAPMRVGAQSLRRSTLLSIPIAGNLYRKAILRNAFFSNTYDPLKRKIFFLPVRWHAAERSATWSPVEARAASIIEDCLRDNRPQAHDRLRPIGLAVGRCMVLASRTVFFLCAMLGYRTRIAEVLFRALRGDRGAWRRIWRRILIFSDQVRGDVSSERRR